MSRVARPRGGAFRTASLSDVVGFEIDGRLASAERATGAETWTIGSSQRGSAIVNAGAISALARPSVHTKCRAEAEARRSDAATRPVTARITVALPTRSRTIGRENKGMT